MDKLEMEGYDHYEISNFGKSGYYSKHNTSYWQDKQYFGYGPGAHGYNGAARRWNIANNMLYIQNLKNELPYFEEEILSQNDQFNEYIMTRLRTKWGVDTNFVHQKFGPKFKIIFLQIFRLSFLDLITEIRIYSH